MVKDFLILFLSIAAAVYSYSIVERKWPEYDRHNKPFFGAISIGLITASINSFLNVFF
ncbi:hypothetical protein PSH12_13720 [Enterococcus casseliflavus]|uniref:hypothetical protein n=1 Tax=Enterococcus casseliflavus TaxID=37734 RepID=UPI0029544BB7|nr:hypothetical protein [Enterococcus casseliflavus]MDV7713655.1 hypothetical protein [Enterococcus casseliflavus]